MATKPDTTSEATETLPIDLLESCRITSLPPSFYYIPNFITPEEETSILSKIPPNRWHTLTHRRLQTWPTPLTPSNVLLAAPLPPWLVNPIVPRFSSLKVFSHTPHRAPNHVLVNEYKPGEGIMPHEDGAAYADVVVTVSLGGSLCLGLYRKRAEGDEEGEKDEEEEGGKGMVQVARILQEPRSLLVTTGEAYKCLLHGIEPIERDEGLSRETVANWNLLGDKEPFEGGVNERVTRISLTYRDVLKVSDAGKKILGFGRR